MRAIVQQRYGAPEEVLSLREVDMPVPGDGEVIVRVRASSANPMDWHLVRGEPMLLRPAGLGGIRRPTSPIPGGDVSGIVEESRVAGFAPGDEVYGFGRGAFAEFVAIPHRSLARKPATLTFAEAAAVPLAGVTALQGLRLGGLRSGQRVMIIGASGGVGTFAVQLARHQGAEVTAVCSRKNLPLVAELGAHHAIDYTTGDPTAGRQRYDLVLQLGGTYGPLQVRRILARRGTLVQSYGDGGRWLGPLGGIVAAVAINPFVTQRLRTLVVDEDMATLDELRALIEAGHLRPVVSAVYPLAHAADAVALVERGHAGGKVVVDVA